MPSVGRYRFEWIVIDFRSSDYRNLVIKELSEPANNSALGLTAQTEEDYVVPGQNCVDELGNNSFVVTHNPREKFFSGAQFLNQIGAELIFYRDALVAAFLKFPQCG